MTEDADERLAEYLEAHADKLEALWYVRRRLLTELDHHTDAIKRRTAERDRVKRAIERVQAKAHELLQAHEHLTGDSAYRGDGFRVRIGSSERVELDADEMPRLAECRPDLAPLVPKPNRKAIKAALDAGDDVPGARIAEHRHVRWS